MVSLLKQNESRIVESMRKGMPIEERCREISTYLFNGEISIEICNDDQTLLFVFEDYLFAYQLNGECLGFWQELVTDYQYETIGNLELGRVIRIALCSKLIERLRIPKIALVNLHIVDQYPSFRFALGIADIGGYLRKYHLAHVDIFDMQFIGEDTIFEKIRNSKYDFVGLSANFGHFPLVKKFVSFIQEESSFSKIIVGNYLAATEYEQLLNYCNKLILCSGEGELSIAQLCINYRLGVDVTECVPNIVYFDMGKRVKTQIEYIDMDDLPVPAFDMVEMLFDRGGVMTLEYSRGCNYGKCSFCPRHFKGYKWRGMSTAKMFDLWLVYFRLFRQYKQRAYVYFADEEFFGDCHDENVYLRMANLFSLIETSEMCMRFDISCRVDQIVDQTNDVTWMKRQISLFMQAKRIGLKRLFVGLEAGSDDQMKRYNKGITINQAIASLRILSSCGFDLRIGFITFDPLMEKADLQDIIFLLNRTDIILEERNDILENIDIYLQEEVESKGETCLYEKISYFASPLELLRGCSYLNNLKKKFPQLLSISDRHDEFGRICYSYKDERVALVSDWCQKWINSNFPFVYALKGMVKQHDKNEILYKEMVRVYRKYTFYLFSVFCYLSGVITSSLLENVMRGETDAFNQIINLTDYEDVISQCYKILVDRIDTIWQALDIDVREQAIINDTYNKWRCQDVLLISAVRGA